MGLLVTVYICLFMTNQVYAENSKESYDIIIENGKIIDGTGNPWYYGDIGIINDRIIMIGNLKESKAKKRIDATGMFVSPGFIDIHTHSDQSILKIPTADNSVRQGITTIVAGNCGGSPLPVENFLEKVRKADISVNYITLVGHNSIRLQVMGDENRAPTRSELAKMKKIVEESMKAGAFGMSTGLYYTPGNYAETKEVIELAKVVAKYGGFYASHIRDESDYNIGLLEAIKEAVFIGEEAKIRVQISHLKCLGKSVWNKSDEVLDIIRAARQRGVNVTFDQYPYIASNTSLWSSVFPAWAREGGTAEFMKKLDSKDEGGKIRGEIEDNISRRGGAGSLFVIKENAFLSELAKSWNMNAIDAAVKIQKNGGSGVISYNMTDSDLENIIKSPFGFIGSDGSISKPSNVGHPRSFGTFPRVLGVYVREKHILTWEEAIRKMTSAPANQLGLRERGIIKQGMIADIVVFNPETIKDRATFDNPSLYPEGIPYVLVNGIIVIGNDKHTRANAGRVLIL